MYSQGGVYGGVPVGGPSGVYPVNPGPGYVFKTVFASLFCFCCFAIFLYPMISTWHVAADENEAYWFTRWPLVSLMVPPLFIGVYVYHQMKGHPNKWFVILSIILPVILFLSMGIAMYVQSDYLADDLEKRCPSHSETNKLDADWTRARNFYACCLVRLGNPSLQQYCPNVASQKAPTNFTPLIQSCVGYEGAKNDNWEYLQFLEVNYGCTGFCSSGQPALWTRQSTPRDACSRSVAVVFRAKQMRIGLQLIVFSCIVLVLFAGWMFVAWPSLKEMSKVSAGHQPISVKG